MTLFLALSFIFLLAGCQKTPDKNAVANKAGGLSKNVIAKPLKKGETSTVILPKTWKASEKRSNDRVTISANLPMKSVKAGNMPVLEMENHVMTQRELEKLVKHFAGDKPLYVPEKNTKEVYEKLKERIVNKEGAFADPVLASSNKSDSANLGKAIELAPDKTGGEQKAEVKFQKKSSDKAFYEAKGRDVPDKNSKELFFLADIGKDRQAHMEAERYNTAAGNTSKFIWETGEYTFGADELDQAQVYDSMGKSDYDMKWQKQLDTIESIMNQEQISPDEGEKQAKELLTELGIKNISLLSRQKTLWFPKGTLQGVGILSSFDYTWQADLEKVKAGYEYTFSPTVNGLPINQLSLSATSDKSETSYAPPFPVETVTIVVTEDGIQLFIWDGMSDRVSTVAKNTSILPFKGIQEKLFDLIYYDYASMGQPADSKSKFIYSVSKGSLGYTYIPAYKNPKHAWLVPAWFFIVKVQVDDRIENGGEYRHQTVEYMLNALDGGYIARFI